MTTTELPVGLVYRPMRIDDAPAWAELLAAVEETDRTGEHYDEPDCLEELTDPQVDLDADSALVLDGNRPVAYQVLHRRVGVADGDRLRVDAAVRPAYRGRGIGWALLGVARRRAAELGYRLEVRIRESNTGAGELAATSGLVPVRWWSEMARELDTPVAPVALPAGLVAHPLGPRYDAARWDAPLLAAHNAAFADHWGSLPHTAQSWAHHFTAGNRSFRPEGSLVVCDSGGEIVGYAMSFASGAEIERTDVPELHVGAVGTLTSWRGRGVAGAMLAHVLGTARALGYGRSSLNVDTHNPTGALGVYERAGYTVRRRAVTWSAPS